MSNEEYHQRIKAYRKKLTEELNAALTGSAGLEAATDGGDELGRALEQLSDSVQTADVRGSALQWLKAWAFSSPTFSDWLPKYLEALRSATDADDQPLREVAFEALVSFSDREAQQRLVDGLENPGDALVPADVALRLLSQDPHAAAREVAQVFADDPSNAPARLEALRVLASDPDSVERFAKLLKDSSQPEDVRTLVATALSSLDRARLGSVAIEMSTEQSALESVVESNVETHVRSLLELPE